jgi:hypothetical protein
MVAIRMPCHRNGRPEEHSMIVLRPGLPRPAFGEISEAIIARW